MKLRSHLIILVVAALLPVLIFAGVMIVLFDRQQRTTVENQMINTARALSLGVDRHLEIWISTLGALATSEHLDSENLKQFYDQATRVLKTRPDLENISLTNPLNQQVINLRRPFGSPPVSSGSPQRIKDVVETGKPVVSGLFVGYLTGRRLIGIFVPVIRGGRVKYVLAAGVPPAFLQGILEKQKLPANWMATIIDQNKIIIARTLSPEKFIGKSATPTFAAESAQGLEGSWKGMIHERAFRSKRHLTV